MAIDVSTIKDVVVSASPVKEVKKLPDATPAKTDDKKSKDIVAPKKEPDIVASKDLPTTEEVLKAATEIKTHLFKSLSTYLKFEVDVEKDEVVVKVLDPETNEVIRQVPSEEVIAIRDRIRRLNTQVGVLHDIKI